MSLFPKDLERTYDETTNPFGDRADENGESQVPYRPMGGEANGQDSSSNPFQDSTQTYGSTIAVTPAQTTHTTRPHSSWPPQDRPYGWNAGSGSAAAGAGDSSRVQLLAAGRGDGPGGRSVRDMRLSIGALEGDRERYVELEGQAHLGEPFTKGGRMDIAEGPLYRSGCTDIVVLILFVLAWGGLIAVASHAFTKGNPFRLTRGIDYNGRICGSDADVKDFPLVYWPAKNPIRLPSSKELGASQVLPVCTKSCPHNFSLKREEGQCPPDAESKELCTWYGQMGTVEFIGRYCFYDSRAEGKGGGDTDTEFSHELMSAWLIWFGDICKAWVLLLASPFGALALGYVYLFLVQKLASAMVWASFFLIEILLLGFGWYEYHQAITPAATPGYHAAKQQGDMILAILLWCGAGILPIIICCIRRRLVLAARILSAASNFLDDCPSVLGISLATFSVAFAFFVFMASTLVYQISTGDIPKLGWNGSAEGRKDPYHRLHWTADIPWALVFEILMFAWTGGFITGISQIAVAHIVGSWYFAPLTTGGRRYVKGATLDGLFTTLKSHLGTAALGGLILAPLRVLRFLVRWYRHTDIQDRHNAFQRFFLRIGNGLSWVYEGIKYMSKLAYIQVGLTGQGLIPSAWTAFTLMLRNPLKFALVGELGIVFEIIGQVAIVLANSFLALLALQHIPYYRENLSSTEAPLIVVVILSWLVSTLLLHCWGLAADTILQCYVADEEMSRFEGGPKRMNFDNQ
ncbi:unnamed protein product [Vitrella brassicaformis CCMP3155]|uniref:Choline transporter-like protein n=1 Tax=Vitrella brassicaformis (strain CCMP3155) TaxID=1169540 RepID=A0A0G4EFQ1_VITBC|nr:unnamed protein product [Vitrella brassicaformis CCMP3155]|eukprot:CEL95355.1 unnamed protein product [Vitrella brassicaformis CCMP3155]